MSAYKKPGIPAPPGGPVEARFNRAVKETLETITGVRASRIRPLSVDASLDDVIAKVNEILEVLQ